MVVGTGVSVQLGTQQTLTDGGLVQINSGDTLTLNGNSGAAAIVVGSGGTLIAAGATLTGTDSSNITVNSGGVLSFSNSTDSVPGITLNAGSNDTMNAVAVSTKLTINSGATIDIAGNDFTNVPAKGIVAAGTTGTTFNLEYNYWGTTSAMQIATQPTVHRRRFGRGKVRQCRAEL